MFRLKIKEIALAKGYNMSTLSRKADVPFITDALAGFLRDYLEGEIYTKAFFSELERRKFIKEV
jgi:hypothetical protein